MATATPVILTQTPPPTSTKVWFPPSATSTLEADSVNQTPTPEISLQLGSIILEDNFSDESLWDIASSEQATSAINNNRLILSAQSDVYMLSLRHEIILSDYYVEVTAQLSLCNGENTYGLLIRASSANYFRFVLGCDGTVSAERYSSGSKLVIQKPAFSGDAPRGSPNAVKIGVWTYGKEMRLYLNDHFQFSIIDPSFPSGTVGVFVRSVNDTPVVIAFKELVIREIGE